MDTMNTTQHTTLQDTPLQAAELHTFKPYISDSVVGIPEGQRMVKCLYKLNKKTNTIGGDNSYVLIGESHLAEQVMVQEAEQLAPYVAAYFQGVEDEIIKKHHKEGGKGFSPAFLSLAKILEHLDNAGQGDRLNKEKIEAWFGSEMQLPLAAAFADKLGMSDTPTPEELAKLEQITGVYKAKFASLASGKTAYRKEEAESLQKALEVTSALDGALGARFYGRLEKMKLATSNDLLAAL